VAAKVDVTLCCLDPIATFLTHTHPSSTPIPPFFAHFQHYIKHVQTWHHHQHNQFARKDDDDNETDSPVAEKEEVEAKPTGGSWFMLALNISMNFLLISLLSTHTVCRHLRMKFVGVKQGPPCKCRSHLAIMNVFLKNFIAEVSLFSPLLSMYIFSKD
jgi:hypothetical protein